MSKNFVQKKFALIFCPLTSDFQSEVGEVFFGEIVGELPAKFGRRFSSFFCWGKSSEAFYTKTPRQISPSNFTTRFWVAAGPKTLGRPKHNHYHNFFGGWHLCRANFAWKVFFEQRSFLRKILRNFPRNVRAFILWVRKKSCKTSTKFPAKCPSQKTKKSPTSFCRRAGRIIFKDLVSDVASKRHLMVHQMKNLYVFSVFHCAEGALVQVPKNAKVGPREMNSKTVVKRAVQEGGPRGGCDLGPCLPSFALFQCLLRLKGFRQVPGLMFRSLTFKTCGAHYPPISETGQIRFRRVRFQIPSSVSFSALTEFWAESSVSSSRPTFLCQSELTDLFSELTELAAELSEFSLPKQYSRNSILPVSDNSAHRPVAWLAEPTIQ